MGGGKMQLNVIQFVCVGIVSKQAQYMHPCREWDTVPHAMKRKMISG